ncbi:MAG: amino acid adenylation domain-containing protein [Fischerella sp. CENA71]|nr:amino acid adenylation domain-containing protein [Fischerella sp. CENA71]
MSFSQERLWFLEQLLQDISLYNIPIALHLKGKLDITCLHRAFDRLLSRHEILRAGIRVKNGQPVQVFLSNILFALEDKNLSEIYLSELPETERNKAVQRYLQMEVTKAFNLSEESLIRACLYHCSNEEEHILLIVTHHIIWDGWSTEIFFRELSLLYNAEISGQAAVLPELPVQYSDFVIWQRQWLQGEVLERQLAYWKKQLSDLPERLQLYTGKVRPKELSYRGAVFRQHLSANFLSKIKTLAEERGVTLFMTLLAAFKLLLHRYTGQNDIVVGSPFANRHHSEITNLIGVFVNTLVLRTDLSGNPSFIELLDRVHDTTVSAYEYQDCPFEKLVECLQSYRDLNRQALFQIMFVLNTDWKPEVCLKDLDIEAIELNNQTSMFDLTLAAQECVNGLVLEWEYSTDIFEENFIIRLATHFISLLEEIVSNPKSRISAFPLLSEEEIYQQLVKWNESQRLHSKELGIHQLFEEQVEKTPQAIAIVSGNEQVTYQELNSRANKIARYLRKLGVCPEISVAICIERTPNLIIGLLAILKAGGAYIPLDPNFPEFRLQFVLEDAKASVLLTQSSLENKFPDYDGQIVQIDRDWKNIFQELECNLDSITKPENLAYAIYTSGSTGRPKGVLIQHQSVLNYTLWAIKSFELTSEDRVLQFASISFDAAAEEIYPTLSTGGTLVLKDNNMLGSLAEFFQGCVNHCITVLDLPTAFWHQMTTAMVEENLEFPSKLRLVIIGGERVMSGCLVIWHRYFSSKNIRVRLVNTYGPTEATIVATFCELLRNTTDPYPEVPIGTPIANVQAYVLDSNLHPVPIGVTGELHIGGVGLARGYLNDPELTSEKFIPNPYNQELDTTIYKTGDLVRWREDGQLEYVGRIDNQVKVRGFRIELGEIEALLSKHPLVKEVVVVARSEQSGNQGLVAYIVVCDKANLPIAKLRAYVKQTLPDYMVPGVFVYLETLPLTTNGKIDRRALPQPNQNQIAADVNYVAPRTTLEKELAEIWANLLSLEQIGIHDSFFTIGGHSLLAIQLISKIRQHFAIELPLRYLFLSPTIAELATHIIQAREESKQPVLPALEASYREAEIPLSFAQQRLWFLEQLSPNTALYNIPAALNLRGSLDVEALQKAFNSLVVRHESLRTKIEVVEACARQVVVESAPLTMDLIEVVGLSEAEKEQAVLQHLQTEALRPFDLTRAPLIRAQLLCLSTKRYVLFVNTHHIVADGWSLQILFRDLNQLYCAYKSGQTVALPPLSVQYADFAYWQRNPQMRHILDDQLKYWQKQLYGVPELLDLPIDRPRPKERSHKGSNYTCKLSPETYAQLKTLGESYQATLFMTLLACFQALLHQYTGQDDIVVGSPIANRHYPEVKNTIGFFVNTLALRTKFTKNFSFEQLLLAVRDITVNAYEHQDVPFEEVVDSLGVSRALNHHPIFQVMFALEDTSAYKFKLDLLEIEEIQIQRQISKFDLALTVYVRQNGLILEFEYTTDIFEQATIARIANNFVTLVQEVIRNPKSKIDHLSFLTDTEQSQLLVEWNKTDTLLDQNLCLHQLFENQVNKTPERIAVVCKDEKLTYWELNQKANQLASYLHQIGVGVETLVAVHIDRSLNHVISVLGILKAGGVYVPLDPAYPEERLQFILEDTNSSVIITLSNFEEKFKNYKGKLLYLDSDWDKLIPESQLSSSVTATPSNLAYIMYTSGSTGKPKGVMCTHLGIYNRLLWTLSAYPITEEDNLLQIASIIFDISIWEIFFPLLKGARLIVALPSATKELKYLSEVITREKVTVIHFVPSLLNAFLDHIDLKNSYSKIKQVISGGEALSVDLKKKFFTKLDAKLYHAYGPTEASISVTHWNCEDESHLNKVPLGRPIANTKIYILDKNLQPVPIGVIGELCIGGIGVARGYLNRPDLTADKFVADPFSNEPGARLYRTGDLARFLSDGNIEFIGRSDDQIKLRGHRIELGEIETTVREHPSVRQAVVLCREDTPGHKRLVSYVVTRDGITQGDAATQHIKALREYMVRTLPEYMVPSTFVLLDALPLTTSGKVDRKTLPAPDTSQRLTTNAYVEPRNKIEEQLAQIWSELLPVDRIGVHDNFFEIGGDSIISIQVISRARRQGLLLEVKHIFQSPTIAGLAALAKVEVADTTPQASQDVLVGEVPLTPIQYMFFDQHLSNSNHYNQALFLKTTEPLEVNMLKMALEQLLIHHDALRLRYWQDADGQWIQTYSDIFTLNRTDVLLCELIDLSATPIEQQAVIIERETNKLQASLDIQLGPVFRAQLFDCGIDQPQRLLLVAHHLVVDAVSWSILLEDLITAYRQLTRGEQVQLPAKTHSYQDWAMALRKYANSQILRAELPYWLTSAASMSVLPADHESTENTEATSQIMTVSLSQDKTEKLFQQVPRAYRTQTLDVLLTALMQAFNTWTGQDSLSLALENYGRVQVIEGIDTSRTCGWFTSVFPVHLQLQEPKDIARSLKQIKEQVRAIPNNGIGYGILSYLATVDQDIQQLKDLPQAQLSFNYLGQRQSQPSTDALLLYTDESCGASISEANERQYQLEVTSEVIDGRFQVSWSYNKHQYECATIQHLAQTFIQHLDQLIEHCCQPENFGYTPSDFPLARMEQSLLDELFAHKRGIKDVYPLAPMQAGFLFRELYEPESSAYFVQMIFELEGNVNETALYDAWQYVTAHCEILRTEFVWQNVVTPVQCVLESIEVPWQKYDWRMLSHEQQLEELELLLRSDRNKGISLSAPPPLLRLHYIALSAEHYYLIWSHHHILLDGWSLPLILKDVLVIYEQLTRGEIPYLGYRRPYRDFIHWLQQRQQSQAEKFWRDYLLGFSEPTLLASKRFNVIENKSTDSEYGAYEVILSCTHTKRLKLITQHYQLTINTIIQGAWSLLLSQYTQKNDIVFGLSVSGRPTEISGVENMIGVFINTLPLRIQLSPEDDLLSLLQRIKEQTGRLHEFAYVSLAKIQSWSKLPKNKVLFDTLFVFENYPMDNSSSPNIDNLDFRSLRAIEKTEYPLTITVLPKDQIRIEMSYNIIYFEYEVIQRIAMHFNHLIQRIVDSLMDNISN